MAITFGCVIGQAIWGPTASPDAIKTLGLRAEALGFDSIWIPDHVVIPREAAAKYPYAADGQSPFDPDQDFYEPLSVLNFLAGCTSRVQLGMHVLIVPYREPIFTAKILATIDALSGGRLIVGAGAGWMEEEFQALGLSTFGRRGAVTTEYLRLFKELWTKDDPRFDGEFVKASDFGFRPKPVRKPHPPIWIGGHSHAALRRVAAVGDGWMPIGLRPPTLLTPSDMMVHIDYLKRLLRDAGRSIDSIAISLTAPVMISRTVPTPRPVLQGRPEDIVADLRDYEALGVSNLNINLPGFDIGAQLDAMEQFAREIMPHMA